MPPSANQETPPLCVSLCVSILLSTAPIESQEHYTSRLYPCLMLNVTFPCKCLMNETVWEGDSLVNHISNDELQNAEIILN